MNYTIIILTLTSLALSSCAPNSNYYYKLSGPLTVEELNKFKSSNKITKVNPTMEEIVLSMSFLQRPDPFEMMRYWVSQGFEGQWKGENWIDLFEGEGEFSPLAVEKIPYSAPLNVKVIVWCRDESEFKALSYNAPFVRYEYTFELEKDGWRKRTLIRKSKLNDTDRVYLYDSRLKK